MLQQVFVKNPANRKSVTVIKCISAGGFAIDLFLVMPAKIFTEKMFNTNLPNSKQLHYYIYFYRFNNYKSKANSIYLPNRH